MRHSRQYPGADTADAALERLVLAGLGQWEEIKADGKGRPTRYFILAD
jgi:hypothetical protein